jgi:2,4-dienoyl-CoA reductase (NADPH2)
MERSYQHLLSPGRIGSLALRNRIIMTPMGSNLGEGDGVFGERACAYYRERARGGAGLLILGSVSIAWPVSGVIPRQAAISEDRHIPGIRAVADAVHDCGGKLALQLHFGGLMSTMDTGAGRPLWTPSVPEKKKGGDMMDAILEEEFAGLSAPLGTAAPDYKVLAAPDITELANYFAAAAERAQYAHVDGVEIHAGHGYIISEFLSPFTNRRTDAYGGSVENRSRLLTEVIAAIRGTVGRDYPVWCRLDSQEFFQPEGISLEDAKTTARLAEKAGADAIHVSAYADASMGIAHSSAHTPQQPELLVGNAAAIKAAVGIPVIAVGRIAPEAADQHIAAGRFDFLAMGRKLLADPYLPSKLKSHRAAEVRPCVYCYTCNSQIYVGGSIKCAVNPETGFERDFAPRPADRKKRVAVVGAGPAGMETARRLALKSHFVTLFEQSDRLGGALRLAARCYEPNADLFGWLTNCLNTSSVEVRLNTRATVDLLCDMAPDEVVVATGAVWARPAIPGAERNHVLTSDHVRNLVLGDGTSYSAADDSWRSGVATDPGKDLVVIGSELVALELAEFFACRGHTVTVIDESARFGRGLPLVRRWRVLSDLRALGVTLLPEARRIAIHTSTVSYLNSRDQSRTLAAEQVIIAKGIAGDTTLADALRAAGLTVHTAGDCNGMRYIEGAMRAAAELALAI